MASDARKESCGRLNPRVNATPQEPLSRWVRIMGDDDGAAADGSAITNPYDSFLTSTTAKEVHSSGGRIMFSTKHNGQFELMGLCSTSGASVTVQVFGFDWVSEQQFKQADGANLALPANLHSPADIQDIKLGMPYNIIRDDTGNPRTLAMSQGSDPEVVKLSFANNCEPYPDEANGSTFYQTVRHQFECKGFPAIMVYVTAVSSGTACVLGRFI